MKDFDIKKLNTSGGTYTYFYDHPENIGLYLIHY